MPGSVYQTPHTDTASFRSNRSHALSEGNRGIKQRPPPITFWNEMQKGSLLLGGPVIP